MRSSAITKSTRFVRQFTVLGFLLLLVVVFAALADGFLTVPNLINKEGLPACPFRTHRW